MTRNELSRRSTMTAWPKDELRKIAEADDLHISPFREHGLTYGTPTWIWSVAVDDALYVRAYNGHNSRWYQAAVRQKLGRIMAAGMAKEVTPRRALWRVPVSCCRSGTPDRARTYNLRLRRPTLCPVELRVHAR